LVFDNSYPNGKRLINLAFIQAVGEIFTTVGNFSSGTKEKYRINNLSVEKYVDSGFFKNEFLARFG